MNFTFTFTADEANLLLKALGELPAKESIGLINKINTEGSKQIEASKKEEVVE